jgi:hypothetical protein
LSLEFVKICSRVSTRFNANNCVPLTRLVILAYNVTQN